MGEFIAFSLAALTFVFVPWHKEKVDSSNWFARSELPGLIASVLFFTAFLWRDYFLTTGFRGLNLATDLVVNVGFFWTFAYFASGVQTGKPSKEHEKAVV